MREFFEISDRYIEPAPANSLLYEPVADGLTFRHTRRYEFDFDGSEIALTGFVRDTLYDDVSQAFHKGDDAALSGFVFALDYGMKPGALDLEKETVLEYYRGISDPEFSIEKLEIRQRIYVFGETERDLSKRFIRDICNGAVHNWKVI